MSGKLRVHLTVLAVAALVLSVTTLVLRFLPISNVVALVAVVGSPYVTSVTLAALAVLVLCHRIVLSIIAVAVMTAALVVQVPWYYLGSPADVGQHTDIRVLSANLRKGRADARSFVGLAKGGADVITVSELTPEEIRRLSRAGIEAAFPYSVLIPAPGAGGFGLWSRFPLTEFRPAKHRKADFAAARIRVPDARFDPLVASVHITSPVTVEPNSFDNWRNGITSIKAKLADFADNAGPAAVIIAGDFNSTPDMRQFRDLLTNGYRDAVEQTGAGFAPTFPSNKWFPPVIVIDHVLTRNAAASSIRTVNLPASDHRALLATIKVPLDPKAA